MAGSCIGCKHFTVTPRSERKDMDEFYRGAGMGRCAIDQERARWLRAEAKRECAQLVAIEPRQIEARRRHLARHRA